MGRDEITRSIRHCEPPHAALPFTKCHRLRIDVHNNNDDDNNDNV